MSASDDAVFERIAEQTEPLRAELERTRRDYERIMIHLSRLSATVTDGPKRTAMELMATVATDYELKVLLLHDLEESHDREVGEVPRVGDVGDHRRTAASRRSRL